LLLDADPSVAEFEGTRVASPKEGPPRRRVRMQAKRGGGRIGIQLTRQRDSMARSGLIRCTVVGVVVLSASACAPDAFQNYKASGFNDYLSTVETRCQPLWIGSMLLQRFDADNAGAQQSTFSALLDSTSRLYYGRITPAQFRESVQSLVLASNDPRTNRSIDCMIQQLPTDRPRSPG
jgi:hypothetical protein